MIALHVSGQRSSYQPFAYPTLAPLFSESIRFVDSPARADVIVFGHPEDLVGAAGGLHAKYPAVPIVYLSEEPFWDTVGPVPPFQRHQTLQTAAGPLPITCLTHHSSAIFAFERIPYFLLTDEKYGRRYAAHFAANSAMSAADWRDQFARAPLRAAFMAENRLSPKLDVHYPGHGVRGLSTWRTELAVRYRTGPVLRAGKGWPAGSQDRVSLPDWHLDKMRMLDRQCRYLSALENTHQTAYVSEKIFDAFALGAIPLYFAAPDHDVHRVAPEGSWVNLYGLDPGEAAAAVDCFAFEDAGFLDRYRAAQAQLVELFETGEVLAQERGRLRGALLDEFTAVLEDQPRS